LTIDHPNNNGARERRNTSTTSGWPFYNWLRQNKYPLGYEVLCLIAIVVVMRMADCAPIVANVRYELITTGLKKILVTSKSQVTEAADPETAEEIIGAL